MKKLLELLLRTRQATALIAAGTRPRPRLPGVKSWWKALWKGTVLTP